MTTFISYSRNNSDFALRLAKDLRAAGLDIWLDQLDIRTGSRWDDEVEKALEKSTTFLIILTPESIQSQNVKDEIGYAIDSGKHILPIILQPCNVPFRIRRFQYVDFSNQLYEESFAEIKRLLANTENMVGGKEIREAYVPRKSVAPQGESTRVRPSRPLKTLIVIGVIGGMAFALMALLRPIFGKQSESPTLASTSVPSSEVFTSTFTPISFTETLEPSPTSTEIVTFTPASISTEIIDDKGVQMVLVPAGEFTMGGDADVALAECEKYLDNCMREWFTDAEPPHQVYLDAFYMDKYEVTNAIYKICETAGVCSPPKNTTYYDNPAYADHPVTYIDWDQAKKYCEWRGGSLPTEAQWEKAARGIDRRTYPWGEGIECTKANYLGCSNGTTKVGSYESGKSPYGIYDLAGNVWEWTADWYSDTYYLNSPLSNPEGPNIGQYRVQRGGAWNVREYLQFGYTRLEGSDSFIFEVIVGFRCVRSAP